MIHKTYSTCQSALPSFLIHKKTHNKLVTNWRLELLYYFTSSNTLCTLPAGLNNLADAARSCVVAAIRNHISRFPI